MQRHVNLAIIFILLFGISFIGFLLFGLDSLVVSVPASAFLIVAMEFLVLDRMRDNNKLAIRELSDRVRKLNLIEYRQVESLLALHNVLRFQEIPPAFREWSVSPDFALLAVQAVLANAPRTIVECGSGTSSVVLGLALQRLGGGNVISLEHDKEHADRTNALLERHRLGDFVKVVWAQMTQQTINEKEWLWYDLTQLKLDAPIDMIVVDGPPESYGTHPRYPTLPLLGKLARRGALVLVDDGSRRQEQETIAMWREDGWIGESKFFETEKGAYKLDVAGSSLS